MEMKNFGSVRSDGGDCKVKEKKEEGQILKNGTCLPPGMSPLKSQVAGHRMNLEKKTFGILQESDKIVLKSGSRKQFKDREIEFYEKVKKSDDSVYKTLSKLIPDYFGTRELNLADYPVTVLTLSNMTSGMTEPCVMDIKIGKRTWDPLALPEKRASEDKKYAKTKQAYGFSITGFQFYDVITSSLKTFDKDYGKNLNSATVIEALKIFLNIAPERPPCRSLLMMVLSELWKILAFFRTQKTLHFYSSSVLIVYDARHLRQSLHKNQQIDTEKLYDQYKTVKTNPQLWKNYLDMPKDKNKKLRKSSSSQNFRSCENDIKMTIDRSKCLEMNGYDRNNGVRKICRTHSTENNYDSDIIKIKQDYTYELNKLTSPTINGSDWVRVNMIDFAHVYPAEENSLDKNYLNGIENLIKILESLLDNNEKN